MIHSKLSLLFATFALALGATACTSPPRGPGADDAMMATLTPAQRASIDAARANYSLRTDELAVARLDIVRAEAELALAKTDLELARVGVTRARNVLAIAETNSADDLDAAREALDLVEARMPEHEMLVAWHECAVTRSERAEDLAQCSQELALANTDLEKARAFSASEHAASRGVDVRRSESRMSECQTRESVARAELAGAVRECEMAERAYEAARSTPPKA